MPKRYTPALDDLIADVLSIRLQASAAYLRPSEELVYIAHIEGIMTQNIPDADKNRRVAHYLGYHFAEALGRYNDKKRASAEYGQPFNDSASLVKQTAERVLTHVQSLPRAFERDFMGGFEELIEHMFRPHL